MAVEKKASLAAKKSASRLGMTWVRRGVRVCGFATYTDVLGENHGTQNGRERGDSEDTGYRFSSSVSLLGIAVYGRQHHRPNSAKNKLHAYN
jgi:hypothetical protein